MLRRRPFFPRASAALSAERRRACAPRESDDTAVVPPKPPRRGSASQNPWRAMLRQRPFFPRTSAALSAGMRRGCAPQESDDTEVVPPKPPRAARTRLSKSLEGDAQSVPIFPAHQRGPICGNEEGLCPARIGRHGGRPSNFCFLPLLNMRELAHMDSIGRRQPARQDLREIYNRPAIVFLTVCTKSKKQILANEAVHNTLREAWKAADSWLVGRYVLMPDHLHLFCSPTMNTSAPLIQWVPFWKSHTARNWPKRKDTPVWQRDFWDTQLRKEESYAEKWQYVVENPVRAGLVTASSDWPYQGEMHELNW